MAILSRARLEAVDGLVHGLGGLLADEVHVLADRRCGRPCRRGRRSSPARCGCGSSRSGCSRPGCAAPRARTRSPSTDGKPEQIERHDGDGDVPLAEDERPGRQLAPLLLRRVAVGPMPAGDGQQRIGRDHPVRDAPTWIPAIAVVPPASTAAAKNPAKMRARNIGLSPGTSLVTVVMSDHLTAWRAKFHDSK